MSKGRKRKERIRRNAIRKFQEERRGAPPEQSGNPSTDSAQPQEQSGNSVGGQGPVLDPHHTRQHLRMITRAMEEEWDVPGHLRPQFVAEAADIYLDHEQEVEKRMLAGRLILAANGQNLKAREVEAKEKQTQQPSQLNVQINNIRVEDMSDDDLVRIIQSGPDPGSNGTATPPQSPSEP